MRNAIHRSLSVVICTLLSGLLAVTAAQAATRGVRTAPAQPPCPAGQAPPPAVDTSEQPAPGRRAPDALPVPEAPVGGAAMGACGVVLPEAAPAPPAEVDAGSWVVQDLDSGAVLAAKDAHARHRPASLIKTLLALVVVRELDPDQMLTASEDDASQECTCVGIVAGGQYSVDALLHGLLMHSGNDVAHLLARGLGGVPSAVAKMNTLAEQIGATDTRAATVSGLDGPGMSSSAYDLSVVFRHAMRKPAFATAVGTKRYEFPGWAGSPPIPIVNDNKLLGSYPGFLGGKTGFTDDARHTYVGGAQRDGKRLAVVLMRGEHHPVRMPDQAAKLLDYGFGLAGGDAHGVGQIVDRAPPEPAGQDSAGQESAGRESAGQDAPASNAAAGAAAASSGDSTDSTGSLLVLAIAAVALGGFIVMRRKGKQDR